MNIEAHLVTGWLLANTLPRENRRFRAIVTIAALAPDADAISYLGGPMLFADLHHAVGHNIFFPWLVTIIAVICCKRSWRGWGKIILFTQLGFYIHWVGDYYLSGFPLQFWWPVSRVSVAFRPGIPLDHPINHAIGYASLAILAASAWIFRRTPVELVLPKLDERIVNLTRPKTLRCHVCGKPANETCRECGQAVCMRHAKLTRRFDLHCGCQAADITATRQ